MRLLLCLCLLIAGSTLANEPSSAPKLMGLDGEQHALSDYVGRGKWVVLNVWATACPYCRRELKALIDFHEAHQADDAMVLGITVQFPGLGYPDREDLYYFSLDYFVSYPLLMADAKLAAEVIGQPVNMIPLTFFYDPAGRLVKRLNGVATREDLERVIRQPPEQFETQWSRDAPSGSGSPQIP